MPTAAGGQAGIARVAVAWLPAIMVIKVLPPLLVFFGVRWLFYCAALVLLTVAVVLTGCAPLPLQLAFSRVVHRIKGGGRPRRRTFEFSEVMPGLYVGCQPQCEADVRALADKGVRAVVSLNLEWELHVPSRAAVFKECGIERLHLPTPDYQALTPRALRAAVDFLTSVLRRRSGGTDDASGDSPDACAYVHCNAGRGRAALVGAAVLLSMGRCASYTAMSAFAEMRKGRPNISGALARFISPQGRALRAWAKAAEADALISSHARLTKAARAAREAAAQH